MGQRIYRIALGMVCLLVLSCSHAAVGSNNPPKQPGSQNACRINDDCTGDELCDLLYPKLGASGGRCAQPCKPGDSCTSPEACNPISGFCENTCFNLPNSCTIQGNTGVCIGSDSKAYCALPAITCPAPLKASGGFCKAACPTSCSNGYTCDAITGTCELICGSGQTCPTITYTAGTTTPTSITATFTCSSVTSTCARQCNTAQGSTQSCPTSGEKRLTCYAPGTGTTTGVCEQGCKGSTGVQSGSTCTGQFTQGVQCADGICQQRCTSNGECSGTKDTCDVISNVCRIGCNSTPDCHSAGLSCSPISATCVQNCTTAGSAGGCVDATRSYCYIYSGTSGTCEYPCDANFRCNANLSCAQNLGVSASANICGFSCASSACPSISPTPAAPISTCHKGVCHN